MRITRISISAAAALLCVAAVSACSDGPDDERVLPEDEAGEASDDVEFGPEAVEVAEAGFGVVDSDGDAMTVSYAITLYNVSDTHAGYGGDVAVTWQDEDGETLLDPGTGEELRAERELSLLMPGQATMITDVVEMSGEPADFAVEVVGSEWSPPAELDGAGELLVDEVEVTESGDELNISFTVESTYPAEVDMEVAAMFRDVEGMVAGGVEHDSSPMGAVEPGESQFELSAPTDLVPDEAELEAVEVHAYAPTWDPEQS